MKKLIVKLPLAAIVLIVFAFISLVWANQQKGMTVDEKKFDEIVFVEDGQYHEENEGKPVAVYSDLWLLKSPKDPDTGLKLGCGVLIKNVGMYQYTLSYDSVSKTYSGKSEKNIRGRHGEKYDNVEFPEKYKRTAILGEVCIADSELEIGSDLLSTLARDFLDGKGLPFQKLNEDVEIKGFKKDSEGNYFSGNPDKPQIGDIKISYSYLTLKSLGKVLVVGTQQNGEIVAGDGDISVISTSSKNLDELRAELTNGEHGKTSKNLFIMAGIEALAALGVIAVNAIITKKRGRV